MTKAIEIAANRLIELAKKEGAVRMRQSIVARMRDYAKAADAEGNSEGADMMRDLASSLARGE